MFGDKERKYKNMATTALLDSVGREIDYKKDKERDVQNDHAEELEYRKPFEHIKDRMEQMQRTISKLETTLNQLRTHEHGADGKPVIKLPDDFGRW